MIYKDLIARMKSVRDYKEESVSPEVIQKLREYYHGGKRLVEGIEIEYCPICGSRIEFVEQDGGAE